MIERFSKRSQQITTPALEATRRPPRRSRGTCNPPRQGQRADRGRVGKPLATGARNIRVSIHGKRALDAGRKPKPANGPRSPTTILIRRKSLEIPLWHWQLQKSSALKTSLTRKALLHRSLVERACRGRVSKASMRDRGPEASGKLFGSTGMKSRSIGRRPASPPRKRSCSA